MSVLNDKQIIELSTIPTFVVRHRVARKQDLVNGFPFTVVSVDQETHRTEDEILKEPLDLLPGDLGYLSHRELTEEEKQATRLMISPFSPVQVRKEKILYPMDISVMKDTMEPEDYAQAFPEERKIISWGTSSFGYDFRVDRKFKIFTNINSCVVDPLDFDPASFVDHEGDYCLVPPNSFVLCNTMEYFKMPKDVVGIVTGKSTIARSGLSIMATPLEPGWEGYLTLEYANTTPLPVKLYAGMGGGQIVFFRGEQPLTTYDQRQGKYQGQAAEPVTPRV